MNTKKIGFIGGGNMAYSLIKGLIASEHPTNLLWVSDNDKLVLRSLANLKINVSACNIDIVKQVDVVVLAVKPPILAEVVKQIAPALQNNNLLIISIVAGITQQSIAIWLSGEFAIVRCMPNMPALVRSGATALYANKHVNNEQKTLAENILRSVGISVWVNYESQLDAVTAVSGSGPAYYFLLMEAMEKAALALGLDARTARLLIIQTALGAAKMALESDETPTQLRNRITSPGGTTQKAVQILESGGLTRLISDALHAAKERANEIAKELGENNGI